MPILTWNRDDQRVIPKPGIDTTPRWHISDSIRKAKADHVRFCRLPAVSAAAHPVVGVFNSNASDTIILCEFNGPVHAQPRIQHSRPEIAVPLFQAAKTAFLDWFSIRNYMTIFYILNESREAVEPMCMHAVAAVPSKYFCTFVGFALAEIQ